MLICLLLKFLPRVLSVKTGFLVFSFFVLLLFFFFFFSCFFFCVCVLSCYCLIVKSDGSSLALLSPSWGGESWLLCFV